jgi:cytochrome c-type biogenesis protein CcmH
MKFLKYLLIIFLIVNFNPLNAEDKNLQIKMSEEQIYIFLKNKYGEWILFDPEFNKNTYFLWLLPIFMFVIGGMFIFKLFQNKKN